MPHDAAIEARDWPYVWQQPYLETLARNPNPVLAARLSGISDARVRQVRGKDPVFAEAERDAMRVGRFVPLQIAYTRATTGQDSTVTRRTTRSEVGPTGQLVVIEEVVVTEEKVLYSNMLLARFLEAWHEDFRRGLNVRHTGPAGGPVEHEHRHEVFREPTPEQALAVLRKWAELGSGPDVIDGEATETE